MFCKNCGASVGENEKFCTQCGTQVEEERIDKIQNNNENVEPIQVEEGKIYTNTDVMQTEVVNNSQDNNTTDNNKSYTTNVMNVPTFNVMHPIILIIFSLCCCGGQLGAIFAILSIIEGNKIEYYVKQNDIVNANECLKKSNNWLKWAYIMIAIGVAITILYFIITFSIELLK